MGVVAIAIGLFFGPTVIDRLTTPPEERLRRRLAAPSMTTQHDAAVELAGAGLAAIEPFLEDADPKVRRNAVRAVRFTRDPVHLDRLVQMLEDRDRLVRYEAVVGVLQLARPGDADDLAAIAERTHDELLRLKLVGWLRDTASSAGPG